MDERGAVDEEEVIIRSLYDGSSGPLPPLLSSSDYYSSNNGHQEDARALLYRNNKLSQLQISNIEEVVVTIDLLGKGGFGTVYRGNLRGNIVAVKRFPKATDYSAIENEMLVMKYLSTYPTVLNVFGYCVGSNGFDMILEYAPFGSLSGILCNRDIFPEPFPTQLILAWFCDMTDAISYIHSKGVKHKDIKAENFLVFPTFRLKLCDFGIAKQHGNTATTGSLFGTLQFMAPEVRMQQGSHFASDIFSFAVTTVQVITRSMPNSSQSMEVQLQHAVESLPAWSKEQKNSLLSIIQGCLQRNPTDRPSAKAVNAELLNLLDDCGSDPRCEGNMSYSAVRDLENNVRESKHTLKAKQVYSIAQLTSYEAIQLLVYLGSAARPLLKYVNEIDGSFLQGIDQVEILQELEDDKSFMRRPRLNNILTQLMKYQQNGISEDIMALVTKTNRLCVKDNHDLRESLNLWGLYRDIMERLYGDISTWDTSKATDMKELFKDKTDFNYEDIMKWDLTNVTDTTDMFKGVKSFDSFINSMKVTDSFSVHSIVESGDVTCVKVLIGDCRVDLNILEAISGNTVLHKAASKGYLDIVRALLMSNRFVEVARCNYYGGNALHEATMQGHTETVKLLLSDPRISDINAVDKDGNSSLHIAASNGFLDVVNIFLSDQRCDVNTVESRSGDTALHDAASNGHVEVVKLLLANERCEVNAKNKYGSSALHYASSKGHSMIVQTILDNDRFKGINDKTKYGNTALHNAAYYGHSTVVGILLSNTSFKGINDVNEYGETALHNATDQGHRDIVHVLLSDKRFTELNKKNKRNGETILHIAAFHGYIDLVKLFLSNEAFTAIKTKNKDKRTARDVAKLYMKNDIFTLLQSN